MKKNTLLLSLGLSLAAVTGFSQDNSTAQPVQPPQDPAAGVQQGQPAATNQSLTNSLSRFGSNVSRLGTNLYGRATNYFSTNQLLSPTGRDTNRVYDTNGQNIFSRTNVNSALSRLGSNVNRFGTNVYTRATNFFSTNQILAPTGRSTNRNYGATNSQSLSLTNQGTVTGGASARDQAFTAQDRTLLVTIRQKIQTSISTQVAAPVPVHFICREGVVTITGYVPEAEQKQQILTVVQQTPGVVRVVDQVQVSTQGEVMSTPDQVNPQVGEAVGGTAQGQYTTTTESSQSAVLMQDQALTSSDRTLLVQLRRAVAPLIGANPLPIHFVCRNGVVTIVGLAANNEQQHQIISTVQQVPGVLRVFDKLEVSVAGGGSTNLTNNTSVATGTTNAVGLTNGMAATGTTNTVGLTNGMAVTGTNATGLSPTSRTNQDERQYEGNDRRLPPGLRKRDQLPPGLEKRQDLPPGLDKREGGTGQ